MASTSSRARWSRLLFLAVVASAFPVRLAAQSGPPVARWRTTLTIGDETDPRAAELGKAFGLAVDSARTIYVADIDNGVVLAFGANGRFRGQVGRKGRGPGEFQSPSGLVIDARDRLWVRDLEVVSRFVRDPRTGLLTRFDTAFRQPLYADWYNARASRIASNGDYLHVAPSAMTTRDGLMPRAVLRFNPTGVRTDSVPVPAWPNEPSSGARVWLDAHTGRQLPGLNHVPFAAIPSWDVTPRGTVVTTSGLDYRIREVDSHGRILKELVRELPAERIDPAERADSLAALSRRLDTLRVPLGKVEGMPDAVRRRELPATYPPIRALFAEADGTLWVRRWSATRGTTRFEVFGPDWTLRRTIVLPAAILDRPTPVLRERFVVAAVEDPDTGGVRLMRFEP